MGEQTARRRIAILPDEAIATELEGFYCGLLYDDRRCRFGAGVSDESIRSYCARIDPRRCFVIGMVEDGRLLALAEVHANDEEFASGELTACCGRLSDCLAVVAHLVQVAAFEAAKRRCRQLIIDSHDSLPELREVLRDVGERRPDGLIRFEIADYFIGEGGVSTSAETD